MLASGRRLVKGCDKNENGIQIRPKERLCQNLQCERPHIHVYFAGFALLPWGELSFGVVGGLQRSAHCPRC
jgi:hypothetical protein